MKVTVSGYYGFGNTGDEAMPLTQAPGPNPACTGRSVLACPVQEDRGDCVALTCAEAAGGQGWPGQQATPAATVDSLRKTARWLPRLIKAETLVRVGRFRSFRNS